MNRGNGASNILSMSKKDCNMSHQNNTQEQSIHIDVGGTHIGKEITETDPDLVRPAGETRRVTPEKFALEVEQRLQTAEGKKIFSLIVSGEIKWCNGVHRQWYHVYISSDGKKEWILETGPDTSALWELFALVTYPEWLGAVDVPSVFHPLEDDMNDQYQSWRWDMKEKHWYRWVE